jgi:hypothetical protein
MDEEVRGVAFSDQPAMRHARMLGDGVELFFGERRTLIFVADQIFDLGGLEPEKRILPGVSQHRHFG